MQLFYIKEKTGKKYILISSREYANFSTALIFTEGGIFSIIETNDFPKTAEEVAAIKRKAFWDEYPKASILYKTVPCKSKYSDQDRRIESYQVFDSGKHLLFSNEDVVFENLSF